MLKSEGHANLGPDLHWSWESFPCSSLDNEAEELVLSLIGELPPQELRKRWPPHHRCRRSGTYCMDVGKLVLPLSLQGRSQ